MEYKVEEFLDLRILHHRLEYFIHWEGYGIGKCTLKLTFNFKNALEKIWEFHHQ